MKLGQQFPAFNLTAVTSDKPGEEFSTITHTHYPSAWKVYFFWPKDFTFVCPTELKGFNDAWDDFQDRDVVLIGGSIDSEFVHLAWRNNHADLHDLKYPMLADIKRELASSLDILDDESGVMQRAIYVVDPQNIVRFSMITDMNVGRNPQEVLRIVDALQTDELCPCNWQPGQATINTATSTEEIVV